MINFFPIKKVFNISKKYGHIIAIEQNNQSYSYKEFWNMISNLSKKILYSKKNPYVAIVGNKNVLSYVSFFSVLLSGGTYIPITSKLPLERIFKIISASQANIVICHSNQIRAFKKKYPKKIFFTEKDLSGKNNFDEIYPSKINKLAYIIFTSGSTGEPKGVCISRKSLEHYLKWLVTKLKIFKGSKCSQFPEIGFDLSVVDIYGSLCSGGTLCPADTPYSTAFPGRFIKDKKIEYLVSVPSLIDLILNSNDLTSYNLRSLKRVFFCGEPLLKRHAIGLFKAKKTIKIINTYGPTEATVSCTYKQINFKNIVSNPDPSIAIGKAIKGMKIQLTENGKISKKSGEIIIYGEQLASGYLNKKDNKNKFYFPKNKVAFFRSGDYAIVKKGEMYFKNRIDNQVKVRGHRIELEEINANIRSLGPGNVTTIVYLNKIICFIANKKKYKEKMIKKFLNKRIPDYMIPNYIFNLKKLPINQNGKLDYKFLFKVAKLKLNNKGQNVEK